MAAALLFAVLLAGCAAPPTPPPPVTTPATTAPAATPPATTAVPATTAMPATTPLTTPPTATTTTPPVATTPTSPPMVAVTIQAFLFSPASVEVPRGTTVTWTNQDSAPHTVVADIPQEFASPTLGTGQSFSFTFTKAGSYPYHCSIHPMMHGNVIVA